MAFLAWCSKRPRVWLSELPIFERDMQARQRTQRRARRVGDLRAELIALLVDEAAPHLQGQLAIMWSTGARVSSLLYGCRLCDYLAAEGREQITFHDTKNGDRVTATVHPWAAEVMRDYLEWRGGLEDREAPLFVTHRRRPYSDNAKACGGQIKHAWRPMIRRACARLRREGLGEVVALRERGHNSMAHEYWRALRADLMLLRQVTPHWFRHLLATTLLATGDLRSTMEQGGWRDVRSVLGYSHDVPERRRALVEGMRQPGVGHRVDTRAWTQKNK
jgi:integrase